MEAVGIDLSDRFLTHLGGVATSTRNDAMTLDLEELDRRMRVAFLARYGSDVGNEVASEVMAWAWEHRSRLEEMDNPAGYLFRVGQSKSRRYFRWKKERIKLPAEQGKEQSTWSEPGLPAALASLGTEQRTAVILVHCLQWTYAEVSELLDLPLHTVRNHIHRGLTTLRHELGAPLHERR